MDTARLGELLGKLLDGAVEVEVRMEIEKGKWTVTAMGDGTWKASDTDLVEALRKVVEDDGADFMPLMTVNPPGFPPPPQN